MLDEANELFVKVIPSKIMIFSFLNIGDHRGGQ
jgi:hypothetical protein